MLIKSSIKNFRMCIYNMQVIRESYTSNTMHSQVHIHTHYDCNWLFMCHVVSYQIQILLLKLNMKSKIQVTPLCKCQQWFAQWQSTPNVCSHLWLYEGLMDQIRSEQSHIYRQWMCSAPCCQCAAAHRVSIVKHHANMIPNHSKALHRWVNANAMELRLSSTNPLILTNI